MRANGSCPPKRAAKGSLRLNLRLHRCSSIGPVLLVGLTFAFVTNKRARVARLFSRSPPAARQNRFPPKRVANTSALPAQQSRTPRTRCHRGAGTSPIGPALRACGATTSSPGTAQHGPFEPIGHSHRTKLPTAATTRGQSEGARAAIGQPSILTAPSSPQCRQLTNKPGHCSIASCRAFRTDWFPIPGR